MMLLDIISKLISTVTGLITLAEHLSKARTQDTAKKEDLSDAGKHTDRSFKNCTVCSQEIAISAISCSILSCGSDEVKLTTCLQFALQFAKAFESFTSP